jgi:hypothetical protein
MPGSTQVLFRLHRNRVDEGQQIEANQRLFDQFADFDAAASAAAGTCSDTCRTQSYVLQNTSGHYAAHLRSCVLVDHVALATRPKPVNIMLPSRRLAWVPHLAWLRLIGHDVAVQ